MAAIVAEGIERVLVRYDDWTAWREDVAQRAGPPPLIAPDTHSCGMCWGSGRIHEAAPNGEGLVPRVCDCCGGGGLVLRRIA